MKTLDEKPITGERKRIANLEEGEDLEPVTLLMPTKMLDELKQTAFDKNVSRASIVREALNNWFKKQENPESNPEAVISDEDLNEILDHCTTYFGGFEIDGEDGFIAVMEENDYRLKDLTQAQWKRVEEKLQVGYEGYTFRPSSEEFAEKFDVLKPTKEQRKWLSTDTSKEDEEETEETEEEQEEEKEEE